MDGTLVFACKKSDTRYSFFKGGKENWQSFQHNVEDLVGEQLEKLAVDLDWNFPESEDAFGYQEFSECAQFVYFSHDLENRFALVRVPIVRNIHISCKSCGFAPFHAEIDSAYLAIPLNTQTWDDWICPKCQ